MVGVRAVLAGMLFGACVLANGATKDVRTVVAQVGAEWNEEAKLRKFHEDLAGRFKDAPAFDEMVAKVKWVVVVDVSEAKRAWNVAARVDGETRAKKGDIVEVEYSEPTKVKTFAELPRVRRVICSSGAADFGECRKTVQMGAFDASGKRTSWGD